MSDSKPSLDPKNLTYDNLAYDTPSESAEKKDPSMAAGRDGSPALRRRIEELAPHLRIVRPEETHAKDPSDAFAVAVAMAMRQQHEAELLNDSSILYRRSAFPAAAKVAIAIAGAALAALGYVALFPPAQPPQHPSPALVVTNHSGELNKPLELGVNVEPSEPGATITIKGLPIGARLTTGEQMSLSEWHVAAEDVAKAVVVPPPNFAGDVKLSIELLDARGASLVTSAMQLAWKAPSPQPSAAPAPSNAAPIAPATQLALLIAAVPANQTGTSPSLPPAPRVDPVRDLTANEVGSLIQRAQDMLAAGDVKGARGLLLRAADARDPRAAYALGRTYDPILPHPSAAADAGPDLAQARSWYQKARDWGAPEAQRQLEALAMAYGR